MKKAQHLHLYFKEIFIERKKVSPCIVYEMLFIFRLCKDLLWDGIWNNLWITASCGCTSHTANLWIAVTVGFFWHWEQSAQKSGKNRWSVLFSLNPFCWSTLKKTNKIWTKITNFLNEALCYSTTLSLKKRKYMDAVSATKTIELQRAESLRFCGAGHYNQIWRNS